MHSASFQFIATVMRKDRDRSCTTPTEIPTSYFVTFNNSWSGRSVDDFPNHNLEIARHHPPLHVGIEQLQVFGRP